MFDLKRAIEIYRAGTVVVDGNGDCIEPKIGQWFCDFHVEQDIDDNDVLQDGELVEYVGDDEYYAENAENRYRPYGTLVLQN